MTRRSTALLTVALLLVAVTAFETSTSTEVDPVVDPEHPDTKILRSICGACEGHLVFPNNGSNTHQHKICFDRVDQMCHSDLEDKYSFCSKVTLDGDDQEHGMNHVIEVCRLVATSRLVRVSRDLSLSYSRSRLSFAFYFSQLENWKLEHCEWVTASAEPERELPPDEDAVLALEL